LQVLKKIKKIKSRDQIFIAAYRHEELLVFKKKINTARVPRALNRPAYLKTQSTPNIDKTPKKDYKKDFYYNCGEHGHIAKFYIIAKKKAKK
jgi:hypothetical protein